MARRIRRRPRVVWLPPAPDFALGTGGVATTQDQSGFKIFVLNLTGAVGATITGICPVVADKASIAVGSPIAGTTFNPSLSDMFNSGYRLRRVVGKIFAQHDQPQAPATNSNISSIATAGLIVLRVNEDSGAPLATANPFAYNPQLIKQWSDPWIWRRSWILGDVNAAVSSTGIYNATWPETNSAYGSVADGPHVDAKTARIIGPEERLFLVVSATTHAINGTGAAGGNVIITADLRALGSMRTSVGNRRNASR